jgi:putative membrane protein
MKISATILLSLSGLIHIYIFLMESVWWGTPKINKAFNVSPEDALTLKAFAFNQGYYNLFLAIQILVGIFLWFGPGPKVGPALCAFSAASMLGAATVLLISAPHLTRAAFIQGAAPLVALILLGSMYIRSSF